jgi:hypothetical protein
MMGLLKEKVRKVDLRGGALIFIIVTHLLVSPVNSLCAIEQPEQYFPPESPTLTTHPGITEIERAIMELAEPIDAEKISWIQSAIFQQEPEEQERLRQALDSRLDEFFKNNIEARDIGTTNESINITQTQELPSQDVLSYEELRSQINNLNLGPTATVEDLRRRDSIVAAIAHISDPRIRYDLLRYLETKERLEQ